MRKILLFVIVGLTCNTMAQKPHKTTGDKPLYSRSFEMYGSSDSTFNSATVYTYNTEQRIISSINYYPGDSDSTSYQYDQKDRMTSMNNYYDGELIMSTVWIYDEITSRIDNYILEEGMGISLDTMAHIVYYGVKDMDAIGESISLMGMEIGIIDCDSMYSYMNMYDGTGLVQAMRLYPIFQSGYPATAVLKINAEMIAMVSPEMATDMVINLTFTYSDQKLMMVKGSTTLDLSSLGIPIPVPLPNFLSITNQYNGDLLTEIKSEIDITVPIMGNIMHIGTKINYLYNSDDNKICDIMYFSIEKDSWDMESKVWYYYENPDEDIVLHSMVPSSNGSDNVGDEVELSVNFENSGFTLYENVAITAKIVSFSGSEEIMTGTISLINPLTFVTYEFSSPYIVPNDSLYTITIYIVNNDDNASNDTLSVIRSINKNVSISSISSNTFSMSQNFPNPVIDKTIINYSIPQDGEINFNIYSINGQLLYNKKENVSFGNYQVELNLSNYASGIYFYTMEYNGQSITKQMSVKR